MFKLVLLIFFIFLSCSAPLERKKQLVYCSEASPSFFNPQLASDGPSFDIARSLYDRLVEFKNQGPGVEPGLALSWIISEDKKTYTFILRKNVSFHSTADFKPTRFFNADDVVFSFQRQKQKSHPYHKINGGGYAYFQSLNMSSLIKDVVKIDSHKVQFVLSRPSAVFLVNMAMEFAGILSKEYADFLLKKKTPEQLDFQPIGTGPFVFDKYIKDSIIRLKANKKYFRKPASLNNLAVSIVPDTNIRFQKLKTGECDIIAAPAPVDLKEIKANSRLKLEGDLRFNIAYLAMNVEKKPFDNIQVRQALHHALNRSLYVNAIYEGYAKIAKNPYPSSLWSYNDQVKDYDYSIKKAKELLKSAGYSKGFSAELWTLPVARPYNPNGKKMGELMQADLAKVNIKVRLRTFDWPTYVSRSKKGEHDMIQFGWTSDNGDPDNFLRVLLSCSAVKSGVNTARWCHPEFDKLIKKAVLVADLKDRSRLYKKAQAVFKKFAPWVTLVHTYDYVAMKKNVEGYIHKPFGSKSFYTVYFN